MLMTKIKENKNSDFVVSFDQKYDIIRMNNKSVNNFYYEEFTDDILLMIDDFSHELIGVQVLNFISSDENLNDINTLDFPNLKKALLLAHKAIKKSHLN